MDFFLLLALLVSACSDSSLLFQGGPCSSRSLSFALNEPCSVEQGAVCLDSSLLLARARRINSLCEEQGRVQLLCFRRTSPPYLRVVSCPPSFLNPWSRRLKPRNILQPISRKRNSFIQIRVFLMQTNKSKIINETSIKRYAHSLD